MGAKIATLLLLFGLTTTLACSNSEPALEMLREEAAAALDTLAAEIAAEPPPDPAAYAERLRTYLDSHPAFYGSAAALLDHEGNVTASPYVYRTSEGYVTLDLAVPSYNIDSQDWVKKPLAANAGVWIDPYFDAGGGEIWMISRVVPVSDAQGVFVIITTDLPVDEPDR